MQCNVSLLAPRCSNDNLQRYRCKHKGRNSILGRPRCFHIADGSLRFPQGIGGDHNKTQHSVWTVDSDFRWEILMLILILDPNPRSCSFPRGLTVITIRPNIQYGFRFFNVFEWKILMLILNLVPDPDLNPDPGPDPWSCSFPSRGSSVIAIVWTVYTVWSPPRLTNYKR